jgi:hypothetical protein
VIHRDVSWYSSDNLTRRGRRKCNAFPVVQYATDRGWPAARWLSTGRLANGTAVVLQEYVTGQPVTRLDVTTMAAILAANDSQARLAHPDAFDDSAQLAAVSTSPHGEQQLRSEASKGRRWSATATK